MGMGMGMMQAPPPQQQQQAGGEDAVRTVFISGFPSDVKERELNNLLRFVAGYEASQMNFKNGEVWVWGRRGRAWARAMSFRRSVSREQRPHHTHAPPPTRRAHRPSALPCSRTPTRRAARWRRSTA